MRKLIAYATITLYVKHYKDDEGNEHIDIDQIGTGGFSGNKEERTLTWKDREVNDPVFGQVGGSGKDVRKRTNDSPCFFCGQSGKIQAS